MTKLLELYNTAEQADITVDCFDLSTRKALSLMASDEKCYIAVNPLQLVSEAEELTILAHELGHCMNGAFYNCNATLDIRQKHENTADKWAILRLVPKDELRTEVKGGNDDVWSLAEHFNVTKDFMEKAICLYKYGNLAVDVYM